MRISHPMGSVAQAAATSSLTDATGPATHGHTSPRQETIKLQNFPSKPEYFTCTALRVRATKHNMCTNMHPGCKEAAWANAQQTFQARGCLAATEAEGNGLVVSMSWYASKRSALHIPGSRSSAASFLLRPFRPMAARLSNLAVLTYNCFYLF